MKKILLLIVSCFVLGPIANAQLANWSNINATNFPTDISGQINGFCRIAQMKFHNSNPNKFYAITAEGGLFITSDAGTNWTVAPGTEVITSSCASVCVDRTNDQVIYLGTGDPNYYSNGAGIYKSTNGGVSFSPTSLTNCLAYDIIQHPTDPNTFVTITNKGIYKTTNNGSAWTATTATTIPFTDLQQNTASNSLILYACTRENAPRFFRSTDFGSTWTEITSGIVPPVTIVQSGGRIAVTPADPNVVYFSEVGGGGMIFKSTDGGLNFTLQKAEGAPYLTYYNDLSTSSGQGNYNNTLMVDRTDPTKVWMQSHNTWYSSDSGVTWTMLAFWSTLLHTDHHHLVQNPFDPSKIYSCNDGGVWLSTDGGLSWTPKSNGLYAYEVASQAGKSSHTDPSFVSIGTQDNGTLYRTGSKWYTTFGGDDYDKREFDYQPNGGYWYNLDDNKRTKVSGGSPATYGIPTLTLQAAGFNRTNAELGFIGNQDIYRTTNLSAATPTWTQISSFNKTIMAIHSCIANPDRLYVITNDQMIYVSNNATAATPVFTAYALPTASNTLASVTAICNNADIVYISINSKVYRSADGGQSWVNITGTLPNVNHRRILSEEYGGTEELVFVATNNAVYYRKASPGTWTNYSSNLPARRSPTDFSMYDDGTGRSRIRYASYGRAVWETDFSNLRVAQASFVADHTTDLCQTNGVVNFTDLSLGGPTAWNWSFPGGTPSTSTAQNPTVTYSTPGTYDVTLTITTGSGMLTATQTNYITAPAINTGGTYNVGVGGNFTTLTAAVNYWNTNCINGPVVFNLTDATYPSETFPITINASGATSSLKIKPVATTSVTGSSASALIIINGADRITIDGSNGTTANTICPPVAASRDLTITNTNTGAATAVVWIQSNGTNGATDNTIKNCNLVGVASTTLFGAGSGSNAIGINSFGTSNHNNAFINNKVQKTQYGIYSGGQSVTNKNTGTVINQNVLNAASPNNILRTGILVKFEDNILISGNFIGNTNVQNTSSSVGIACGSDSGGSLTNFSGSEVTGVTITYNYIDNIVRAQSFGNAAGIYIAAVTTTTGSGPNLIANNMISRISAPTAAAGQFTSGITIGGGRNSNTKVYYNTVSLSQTQSANIQSFGAVIGGAENYAIVDMRNNIIINPSTSANRNYAFGLGWSGTYPRLNLNNNDYYTATGPFGVVGGLSNSPAGDRTTFANWKSETGTDGNSKNVLPEFVAATDLHLNITGTNNLANLIGNGTPVAITTDIDCSNRYSNPDIGADENCIAPSVPTLTASANAVCAGGSATLSIASGNLNKATEWKWYSGSCGGTLAGTGTAITVSPLSTTTYYARGEGGCVTPGSCASVTITVNMPAPAITGPTAVCTGCNATLDAGAGFTGYSWSDSGGNSQTASYTIAATTIYTVTVTDAMGCTGSDTHQVTAIPVGQITCPANMTVNISDAAFTLTGENPAGGTYSGLGVNAGMFNPSVAGIGVHTITYDSGNNICTFTISVQVSITGGIVWENNLNPVKDVNVQLLALPGLGAVAASLSNTSGQYSVNTTVGGDFRLLPSKNINLLNGLTAADATRIQQHISNNPPLIGPYKRIAADVNKSNSITTYDATLVTQVLANNPAALAVFNTSWRFVPQSYSFPNPNIPWGFPEKIDFTGLSANQTGQNFIGVKLGDVNGSANPLLKPMNPVVWSVNNQMLKQDELISVSLNANQFKDIAAFQMALDFDPAQLEFIEVVSSGVLDMTDDNFGAFDSKSGEFRVVWSAAQGRSLHDGAAVFTLRFKVLESSRSLNEVLSINEQTLEAHAYNTALTETGMSLVFMEAVSATSDAGFSNKFELCQNQPNPASDQTSIGFVLPDACEARLRVMDINGRVIMEINQPYMAGYHQETIHLNGPKGVMVYELITPFGTLSRKMVVN